MVCALSCGLAPLRCHFPFEFLPCETPFPRNVPYHYLMLSKCKDAHDVSHVLCLQMTLGHEFGAGAACLKCKDKCEGFELHFWRCVQHLSSFCKLKRAREQKKNTSVKLAFFMGQCYSSGKLRFLLTKQEMRRSGPLNYPGFSCLWNNMGFHLKQRLMKHWCVWTIVHTWLVFPKTLTSPGAPAQKHTP